MTTSDETAGLANEIAHYVADHCTTLSPINGKFFRCDAGVDDDGYVTLKLEKYNFDERNVTVRAVLHVIVTSPETGIYELPTGVGTLDLPSSGGVS